MGWRNWNFFQGAITQAIMHGQMAALANRSRPVVGRAGLTSLADIGCVWLGGSGSCVWIVHVATFYHRHTTSPLCRPTLLMRVRAHASGACVWNRCMCA